MTYWLDESCWDIWPGKYAKTADQAESATFWHFFCENKNAITQWGSPRSTWFMSHFESVFRDLFDCMISFLLRRNYKNVFFFCDLCSVVRCLCVKWPHWNLTKILKFSKCSKLIFNLCCVSFICIKFGTCTIFSAIAIKGSTYPLD